MYSMTGFSKQTYADDKHNIKIEIRSLNHKYLDVSIKAPRFLNFLESQIRSIITKKLVRGKVDVNIHYTSLVASEERILQKETLDSTLKTLKKIQDSTQKHQVPLPQIQMRDILYFNEIFKQVDNEENEGEVQNIVMPLIEKSVEDVLKFRASEAKNIISDVENRINNISTINQSIRELNPIAIEALKQRYDKTLQNIIENIENATTIDAELRARIASEVAIVTDKTDITEETVRIDSFVKMYRDTISTSKNGHSECGKKLDFIAQELLREFNTIGSKVNNIDITNYVIAAKSEIDKIKEQAMNIV